MGIPLDIGQALCGLKWSDVESSLGPFTESANWSVAVW